MQRGPAREWRALEAGPLQLRRALLRHAEPLRSTRLRRETWLSRALLRRLAWPCRLPQLLQWTPTSRSAFSPITMSLSARTLIPCSSASMAPATRTAFPLSVIPAAVPPT